MISHSKLLEILEYDAETGEFWWKIAKGRVKPGHAAGTRLGENYRQIMIDGRKYSSHVLAWFYVTGSWPTSSIDHKNHEDGDRFSNLRIATGRQNRYNTAPKRNARSKWKGVVFDKGRRKCWKMTFSLPCGRVVQKRYEDEREAAEEYMFLALEHHGDFARFE